MSCTVKMLSLPQPSCCFNSLFPSLLTGQETGCNPEPVEHGGVQKIVCLCQESNANFSVSQAVAESTILTQLHRLNNLSDLKKC